MIPRFPVGLLLCAGVLFPALACASEPPGLLRTEDFHHYVDALNQSDPEDVNGGIPNAEAWAWMTRNVPFLACPDANLELTYYYRWWAYRKHIEKTGAGFVVTEFLRPVQHSTDYNAISCALGLHIAEGRWLRDPRYLDAYVDFWLHSGAGGGLQEHLHQFSGWLADALYDRWLADGNRPALLAQFDALRNDYAAWEQERLTPSGLFWQRDVSDGMESSISGGRKVKNLRPTINTYMYANARALAAIAGMKGDTTVQSAFQRKAAELRKLTQERLWNAKDQFFETVLENGKPANVREEIGYTPWYFDLPLPGKGFEVAWKQLMDPQGFYAPYGPTTAERRHPEFALETHGDDCQWNGPNWPFATSITLRALANLLNRNPRNSVSAQDYRKTFDIYTRSQRLKLPNGQVVPWVDENLNPLTGVWWARELKLRKKTYYGRGDHYNHSSYADLVITGLVGLRPRADDVVEVNPLAPPEWDWFALDRLPYHGRELSIWWDRTGEHFHRGKGLSILADGKEIAHAATLTRVIGKTAP